MFLKWCCTMFLTFQHPSLCVPLALNPRLVGTPIILLRVFVLYPVFLGQFGGCEAFKDWHVGIPGWNIRSEHVPVKAHWAFRCRVHLKTRHLRLPQVLPSWRKPSWHVGKSHMKEVSGVLPLPSPGWGSTGQTLVLPAALGQQETATCSSSFLFSRRRSWILFLCLPCNKDVQGSNHHKRAEWQLAAEK